MWRKCGASAAASVASSAASSSSNSMNNSLSLPSNTANTTISIISTESNCLAIARPTCGISDDTNDLSISLNRDQPSSATEMDIAVHSTALSAVIEEAFEARFSGGGTFLFLVKKIVTT